MKRPNVMRKVVLISVAIFAAMSLCVFALAFAEEDKESKSIIIKDGKVITLDADGDVLVSTGDGGEVRVVKSGESGAYLGIFMEELSKKLIKRHEYPYESGVLVTEVVDDSPAGKAGLEEDDIIYEFDAKAVTSPTQLSKLVREKAPGDEVQIVFYREGERKELSAVLGERELITYSYDWDDWSDYAKDWKVYARKFDDAVGYYVAGGMRGRLGVKLSELNDDLASYFKVEDGALVLEVNDDSPAEEAGIKAGDIVVAFAGEEIAAPDDLKAALTSVDEAGDYEVVVVRKGKKKTLTVTLEEAGLGRFEWHMMRPDRRHAIEIPEIHVERLPELKIEEETLRNEIEVLEERLKEIEKRLKELEKK
jgi:C-terminal processing protease CtpA/Prc